MTVNDITFRSQQQVEGAQQFQDQRRDSAMQGIGNAVQGLGQQIQETQRYQQEFAFQQQQAEREFAMQSADANMKLALQQQEMQFNQQKLQQMAQIDMVDMSREQLRSAKLQNDSAELEFKRQQKLFETMGEDRTAKTFAEINKTMSALEWNELGFEPDPTSMTFKPVDEKTQAARRESLKRQSSFRDPDSQMQQTLNGLYNAIQKAEEDGDENTASFLRERVQQLTGGSQPQAQRQQPARVAPADQSLVDEVASIVSPAASSGEIVGQLAQGGGMGAFKQGVPPEVSKSVSQWLVANRSAIHQRLSGAKSSNGRTWLGENPEATVRRLANTLRNPSDPNRIAVLNMLLAAGAITREQAEGMVK